MLAVSERKRAANRANARNSTGPRTPAGKARIAGNARRHGLSVPASRDPGQALAIEALARHILGGGGGRGAAGARRPAAAEAAAAARDPAHQHRLSLAREIAAVEIDLLRVRRARHDLIAGALADPEYQSSRGVAARIAALDQAAHMLLRGDPLPAGMARVLLAPPQGAQKFALILGDLAGQLAAMDRYERRARARRKFAIRAFDAARRSADGVASIERANHRGGEVNHGGGELKSAPSGPRGVQHESFWQNKATAANGVPESASSSPAERSEARNDEKRHRLEFFSSLLFSLFSGRTGEGNRRWCRRRTAHFIRPPPLSFTA